MIFKMIEFFNLLVKSDKKSNIFLLQWKFYQSDFRGSVIRKISDLIVELKIFWIWWWIKEEQKCLTMHLKLFTCYKDPDISSHNYDS